MKLTKEYVILGLIIIALAVYVAVRNTDRTHYRLPTLEAVATDRIDKIEIAGPGETVSLRKSADKWVVSGKGYPADTGKVEQILDVIGQLTLTALVSESENYNRYELDADRAITVKAWAADALQRELTIGKGAPSFKHTFVRLPNDPRVYHARGHFRYAFEETVDGLRDKTVFDFEIKEIREIHVTKNGNKQSFLRKESPGSADAAEPRKASDATDTEKAADSQPVWTRDNGEPLDGATVNRFLSTLDGLACDRYIYDRAKGAFENPVYTVKLVGTQEHTLKLFAPPEGDDKNYPAVSSFNAYPFELTAYRAEDIIKTFDEKASESEISAPAAE